MNILDTVYFKKKKEGLARKHKAWLEAKRIAYMLGKKFSATEVILYGSLSHKERPFDQASDIDLAVRGLGDKYFKAYGYCLQMSPFNLDIRPYEDMPLHFKYRVDKEGVRLYGKRRN